MGFNSGKNFHCSFYVSGWNGWRREMTGSDRWGPRVSESGRREAYRFGNSLDGPRACFFAGPKVFPEVQFHIFIFFSSFPFLISDLFPNLLQIVSIQFKRIPSAFK
jgi:hypothetical protein